MSTSYLRQCTPCATRRIWSSSCSRHATRGSVLTSQVPQTRSHSTDQASPLTPPPLSSVSQNEVSHFTKLASSWWDPHGPSRLLHLMNPLRHDFISSCLESDYTAESTKKYKYLDIGCGGGIFATSAARLPHTQSVTAIDPTPSVIAVAKAKQRTDPGLTSPKLTYINCAIEDLCSHTSSSSTTTNSTANNTKEQETKQPTKYDILTLFEVLEHIAHPSTFLSTALTHLSPQGWLVGSTISRHPLSYITTKLIAEAPLIGVVPAGTHDWNQYINPDELRGYFEKENVKARTEEGNADNVWGDVRVQGVVYVPMLGWKMVDGSEGYGNYFFAVQKLR